MITTNKFFMYCTIFHHINILITYNKVIKSPSFIFQSSFSSGWPKTILYFIRIKISKSINITIFKKLIKWLSFLRSKSSYFFFTFCIININFLMSYIQISCYNNRFLLFIFKSCNILKKVLIPFVNSIF